MTNIGFTVIKQARRDCPHCDRAIAMLDDAGYSYSIRALGRPKLKEEAERAKMTTIPIVYHGVRLIGGADDLAAYLSEIG